MKCSKELELLYQRLDEMRIHEYERISAKAHLARAEALADLLAHAGGAARGLFRRLVLRPLRRFAASAG